MANMKRATDNRKHISVGSGVGPCPSRIPKHLHQRVTFHCGTFAGKSTFLFFLPLLPQTCMCPQSTAYTWVLRDPAQKLKGWSGERETDRGSEGFLGGTVGSAGC